VTAEALTTVLEEPVEVSGRDADPIGDDCGREPRVVKRALDLVESELSQGQRPDVLRRGRAQREADKAGKAFGERPRGTAVDTARALRQPGDRAAGDRAKSPGPSLPVRPPWVKVE
jgi:hypothetical protein